MNDILKECEIERIFLGRNGITKNGLNNMKESLMNHETLKKISFSGNFFF
jgi:RNA-binding protein YhbY